MGEGRGEGCGRQKDLEWPGDSKLALMVTSAEDFSVTDAISRALHALLG